MEADDEAVVVVVGIAMTDEVETGDATTIVTATEGTVGATGTTTAEMHRGGTTASGGGAEAQGPTGENGIAGTETGGTEPDVACECELQFETAG